MKYFIAGNLWLFVSFFVFLGRKVERTGPTMYSFYGMGGWLYPSHYNLLVIVTLILGVILLIKDWKSTPKPA